MSRVSSKTPSKEKSTPKRGKKTRYLTTRLLNAIVKKAFREASDNAMKDMGYVVECRDGIVVRVDANGEVTKIAESPNTGDYQLKLD